MSSGGCLPPPLGYIHVYGHSIQTSSSLKPLGQTLCGASLRKGIKININGQGHMTKIFKVKVFTRYGHGGHLGHVTWTMYTNVYSLFHRILNIDFGFDW